MRIYRSTPRTTPPMHWYLDPNLPSRLRMTLPNETKCPQILDQAYVRSRILRLEISERLSTKQPLSPLGLANGQDVQGPGQPRCRILIVTLIIAPPCVPSESCTMTCIN